MTTAPRREPIDFADVDEIAAALRGAGHRVSAPTRAVLEALFSAEGPVSAERIADGLRGQLPGLELTSVYRNLERLERLGVVSHVHVGHGAGLYALTRGGDPEYLVCERCGAVTTVQHTELALVRDAVRAAFGYEASFRHFPIHGLCPQCSGDRSGHVHEEQHNHQHSHGDLMHSHPHTSHDHEHR